MIIDDFLKAFNKVVPLAAVGYAKDAVGVQVGYDRNAKLHKVLLAYEITDEVIDEALEYQTNLIVCYHPLIFPNISSLTDSTRTGALLRRLIKHDIALYVIHTALDTHPEYGTSRLMADALGLQNIRTILPLQELLEKIVVFVPKESTASVREAMWKAGAGEISNYSECSFSAEGLGTFRGSEGTSPAIGKPLIHESVDEVRLEMICECWNSALVIEMMKSAHPYQEVAYDRYSLKNSHPKFGMGSIGERSEFKSLGEVLAAVSEVFGTPTLRHNGANKEGFLKVAMVGGAGMEYYGGAKSKGADVFITSDIRYHEFHKALNDNVLLIDAGHAETERFVTDGMLKAAKTACNFVNLHNERAETFVIRSRVSPNVVRYYQ